MFTIIYGIKSETDLVKVCKLNPDCIGFSLNDLSVSQINDLIDEMPKNISSLVTTHLFQPEELEDQIRDLNCQILHLGSHPDKLFPQTVYRLKNEFSNLKFAQVIPVIDQFSIEIAKRYEQLADYIFLDSFNIQSRQLGATGETHDWSISAEIVKQIKTPVILAGGLGPENVAAAIKTVQPWGVVTKTRTDFPDGSGKDLAKVESFLSQVKNI